MHAATQGSRNRPFLVLALAVIARILFALITAAVNGPLPFYREDSNSYILPAQSLLHGSYMSSGVNSVPGAPELYRTPGYPVLLLPAVALHHVVIIGLLENFLLVIGSALLIWKIVSELLPGSNAAIWAVVLYCFDPLSFVCSETIMSDTAFTTFFLLFVWALLRFFRRPTFRKLAIAALTLGCATYIRPIPIYLGFWLVPVFLFFPTFVPLRRRAFNAILFPVLFISTLVPWVVRNALVADYAKFTTAQAYNLYFMSAAAVEAKLQPRVLSQTEIEQISTHTVLEWYFIDHPDQRSWPPAQVARFWDAEGKNIVLSHLSTYAPIHARACVAVLFNPGITEVLQSFNAWPRRSVALGVKTGQGTFSAILWVFRQSPAAVVFLPLLIVLTLLYYALGLAGLRRMPFETSVLFCALVLYLVVISGIPNSIARYRVPFLPLVCISAGIGIEHWRGKKSAARKASAAPIMA